MANRNEFAVFEEFVTGLFAKFAQRDLFDCLCGAAGITAPGYSIDLARGHFPDGFADRNAFLANEQNFTLARHWRDDHSRFAMYNCPRARLTSGRRSDALGYDFEMRIGKVPFARDGFPRALFHAERL